MHVAALAEQLVAIPSAREGEAEGPLGKWLTDYLQERLPRFQVHHQQLYGGRFNVVASDGAPCRVLFAGHMDTLPVGSDWTRAPLGQREGNALYGRGAFDMKSGIAAFLCALAHPSVSARRGVSVLLYCDEEYDFEGMRHFLVERDRAERPGLVVCPEPTQLRIRNGCRGLVELRMVVRGRSGHAARPASGRSAFHAFTAGIQALDAFLAHRAHDAFGGPTRNVTAVRCGQFIGQDADGRALLGDCANIIPDYAEAIVEVRTNLGLDAAQCIDAFTNGTAAAGGETTATVKFDLRAFLAPREALRAVDDAQRAVLGATTYDDLGTTGYSDIQLLAARWGVPAIMLGPAGANAHAADEYVDLASVETLERIFVEVIQRVAY